MSRVVSAVSSTGIAILEDALPGSFMQRAREAVQTADRAERAFLAERSLGSDDAIRMPMKHDDHFFRFLEQPYLHEIVDALLSPHAILRYQQAGFATADDSRVMAHHQHHMNFKVVMNGYRAGINLTFALDDMLGESSLRFILGSHQRPTPPRPEDLSIAEIALECPAGSVLVYDSTIWHRDVPNLNPVPRHLVDHLFVRHFIKPYFDYPRALGPEVLASLPERSRRFLGWESRIPSTLEEFYAPVRLYLAHGE